MYIKLAVTEIDNLARAWNAVAGCALAATAFLCFLDSFRFLCHRTTSIHIYRK